MRSGAAGAVCALWVAQAALLHAVKVKVVMHSEQEDSKPEDEEPATPRAEPWEHRARPPTPATHLPFLRRHDEHSAEAAAAERRSPLHPNDMLFPLIYRQSHINSMFKFGDNWYTWSAETRGDGSRAVNYYVCYDEPKRCDEVGWERTDKVPTCAFEIDSVMPDDRACLNVFGTEPHPAGAAGASCDGGDQMKVSDIVRSCGPRLRSLWRFVRVGRRPAAAAKPADVNSLLCEDEEECYLTVEYRIHHDRITFSLHEPARGQTFKSVLKREQAAEETTESRREHRARGAGASTARRHREDERAPRRGREEEPAARRGREEDAGRRGREEDAARRGREEDVATIRRGRGEELPAARRGREDDGAAARRGGNDDVGGILPVYNPPRKFRLTAKSKPVVEGKGIVKERNDSGYGARHNKNKIKVRDEVSDEFSNE